MLGSGRCPGGGNGNPLQYSCLETSMDRAAWRATVPGVTKTRAQLSTRRHRQEKVEGGRGPSAKSSTKNLWAATLPSGPLQVPSAHSRRIPQNIPPSSVVPTCQHGQDHQHGQDASLGSSLHLTCSCSPGKAK